MEESRPRGYRFGTFELDVESGELRRRGLKVRLRGRPIEILTALLARPGEIVSREDLRAQLWNADTFVDFDHGLHSAMNKLREGLGDAADNPRFIETVPRRGYRFIAPVEAQLPAPKPATQPEAAPGPQSNAAASAGAVPSGDHRTAAAPSVAPAVGAAPIAAAAAPAIHPVMTAMPAPDSPAPATPAAAAPAVVRGAAGPRLTAFVIGILAVAAILAIAGVGALLWLRAQPAAPAVPARVMLVVLPFDNLSGDRDQDFFSDGITDELIAQLGALDPRRIGVIARTTALHYKRSGQDVVTIGHALNVDYLLEGSVRRDAQRVRITAQLIDVKSQTQLWSETYERDLKDVLMLQRDVGMRLVQSLAGRVLSPASMPTSTPATPPFAAYELVLRGRALRQQATEEGAWRCVATYEEAIRVGPDYAPAHAGLADCYRLLGAPGWEAGPPAELMERARRAVDRALALDPSLAEAYAVRAMIRFNLEWDLDAADRDLTQALTLNPSLARAHQYRSAVLTTMGKFDQAVESARRAQQLDPMSAIESTTLGVRLYYAGRYAEAVPQFMQTLKTYPGFTVAVWGLGETYREQGKPEPAIAELRRAVELSNRSAYMRAWLAHALAAAGQREEATAIRTDIERIAGEHYVSPFLMALMASGFGERQSTLDWLGKTMESRSGWMPFVPVEPQFQWLHGDPQFEQIVARIRPQVTQP